MEKQNITKKMIVEYSLKKGMSKGRLEGVKKQIILPVQEDGKNLFVSIPNLKPVEYGFVVYTGNFQSPEDLLMKLNLTSKKISPSFDWYEKIFASYLEQIGQLKIADVVKLSFEAGDKIVIEKIDIPSGASKSHVFK